MTVRSARSSALLCAAMLATAGCFGMAERTRAERSADGEGTSIPRGAAIMREGRGEQTYAADADGQLFVQDARTETTILARKVRKGEVITVLPNENRIRLQDTVLKTDLKRDNAHRIYLLRERSDDADESNSTRNARDGVPPGARLIGEDVDNEISFKASRTGRAYIVDADQHKVVETLTVGEGRRFTFSPRSDRATLDGRPAVERDFDPKTNYRIYFDH